MSSRAAETSRVASPSSSRPIPPSRSTKTVSWAPCSSTSTRSRPRASRTGDSASARSFLFPLIAVTSSLGPSSAPAKRKRGPQPTLQRGTDLQKGTAGGIIAIPGLIRPSHDRREVVLGVPGPAQGAVGTLEAADADGMLRQAVLAVGPERPQADPGEADRPRLHGLLE